MAAMQSMHECLLNRRPLPEGLGAVRKQYFGHCRVLLRRCASAHGAKRQIPSKVIVVSGATLAGVGCMAISMLKKCGYEVHAITGKPERHDWLRSLGVDAIIDRPPKDFSHRSLERSQWGGGIDNVGGVTLSWMLSSVAPWGNVVSVGLAADTHVKTSVMPFILRSVSLLGVSSANCPHDMRVSLWQRLADGLSLGNLEGLLSRTVRCLTEIPAICDEMLASKVSGRILVEMGKDNP
ncbi:MAG: zinc-binding dehydrogenase [Candidatus Eutrophobiaceae bacterium]